jgi:hypothetical protein
MLRLYGAISGKFSQASRVLLGGRGRLVSLTGPGGYALRGCDAERKEEFERKERGRAL